MIQMADEESEDEMRETIESANAQIRELYIKLTDAIHAYDLIRPFAEEYASAGGEYGPEMRDFRLAERMIGRVR